MASAFWPLPFIKSVTLISSVLSPKYSLVSPSVNGKDKEAG